MEAAKKVDEDFRGWKKALRGSEIAAITAWQGTDRRYQRIQAAVSGVGSASENGERLAEELLSSVLKGRVGRDLTLWRGIRSSISTFGVDSSDLASLIGRTLPADRFIAASLSRDVAIKEFTDPPLKGGPALLRLRVRSGTNAAWIAGAGDPALREQFEMLLRPGVLLKIEKVEYPEDVGVPVISVEVSEP
ncbi:MAG: hypothetical protein QM621_15025 [Aeromicrobium sp.]|uniref:hypothetical protein n=1 Tax=Aeromicrobium sp. TaxID=1871063 RepID=UPI0039E53108